VDGGHPDSLGPKQVHNSGGAGSQCCRKVNEPAMMMTMYFGHVSRGRSHL